MHPQQTFAAAPPAGSSPAIEQKSGSRGSKPAMNTSAKKLGRPELSRIISDITRFLPHLKDQSNDLRRLGTAAESGGVGISHKTFLALQDRVGEFESFVQIISTRLTEISAQVKLYDESVHHTHAVPFGQNTVDGWLDDFCSTRIDCLRVYARVNSQFVSKVNKNVIETREYPHALLSELRQALTTLDSLLSDFNNDPFYVGRVGNRDIKVMHEMRRYVTECWNFYSDLPSFDGS